MNAQTKLSSKGQVVIPKDVRDSLGLQPGETLTVRQAGRQIILEAIDQPRAQISYAEFCRRRPRYDGPPVAIADMKPDFARLWSESEQEG